MARRRPPSAAAELIPDDPTLDQLRELAAGCTACDLHEQATQTVFGDGADPGRAELMLVGEQPGDREDVAGAPFVGPAERVLATVHPSSILRGPPEEREEAMATFVADFAVVAEVLDPA